MSDTTFNSGGWHHAPLHRLGGRGAYMVTCSTLHKMPVLNTSARLSDFLELHEVSAKRLNHADGVQGRKVWYNYWESHITFETTYYARLKYVHDNPVHHGVVCKASNYRWCSRAWLEGTANAAFVRQLDGFNTDCVKVPDLF